VLAQKVLVLKELVLKELALEEPAMEELALESAVRLSLWEVQAMELPVSAELDTAALVSEVMGVLGAPLVDKECHTPQQQHLSASPCSHRLFL